jgi:class 3 adenylate cyclase
MGIDSGEVIVGTIGRDLCMDYTAQGHTVGLAQRIRKQRES